MNFPVRQSLFPTPSRMHSFNLDAIWHLRHTVTQTMHGWHDTFRTAVTVSTQGAVQMSLHVSSLSPVASPLTTTIRATGFSYGTLAFRSPLSSGESLDAVHDGLEQLATTCSLVLQHLEALAWLDYCQSVPQRQPITAPTTRERDILVHLAQGVARTSLPHLLAIETGTVKKHLENLYRKFGVHSIAQALAIGQDAGLFRYLL